MQSLLEIKFIFKKTFDEWLDDKAPKLAAALAFYTAFALSPILIIVIAVAGLMFGAEAVRGELVQQIAGPLGQEAAKAIEVMVAESSKKESGIMATVIGIVTLFIGATGVFVELQDSMNIIWNVPAKPSTGILGILRQRFLSFAMVVGIAFLLMVSLVVSTGLAAITAYFNYLIPGQDFIWHALNFLISLGFITFMFAMMFKVLPDVKIAWGHVWQGAFFTALLFTIGKTLIGLYLGHGSITSTFGAAGSFAIILLWVYYSSQVFFFGAELTQVYSTFKNKT